MAQSPGSNAQDRKVHTVNPAMELFAGCMAQRGVGSGRAPDLATISSRIEDWPQALHWLGQHGLLPLVTSTLKSTCWATIPANVRSTLDRRHKEHVRRALTSVAALLELQALFNTRAIHAVSWKGPLLGLDLYGNYIDRECADLDFLIEPRDLPTAVSLLESAGFIRHEKTPSKKFNDRLARLDRDLCLVRGVDGTYIELHSQIMPSRFSTWQDRQTYLDRSQRIVVNSVAVRTLCPEDLLLSLCAHGIKHTWEHLKWVVDVALFVRRYRGMDWAALLAHARESGKSFALVHGVLIAGEILGIEMPEELNRAAREQAAAGRITRLLAARLMEGDESPMAESDTSDLLSLLFPSKRARLRFTVRRAFEPRLSDFNDDSSRFVLVNKWRRMVREAGAAGTLSKTLSSVRRIW